MTPGPTAANVFVQPDPRRNRVTFSAETDEPRRMRVEIDGTPARGESDSGRVQLDLQDFEPWSPASPQLYTARCSFPDAPGNPGLEIPFGMREVSLQDQRVTINQRPTVLKGALYRGSEHAAGSAAVSLEQLRNSGFNWIRIPLTHATPNLLSQTDALGLLVSLDATAETDVPSLEQAVRTLRNHASLFGWHLGRNDQASAAVRKLDPTRLVFTAAPDGARHARLYRPFRDEPETFDPVNVSVLCPLSREAETFLERVGHGAAATFVTVHGLAPWHDDARHEGPGLPETEGASTWRGDLVAAQADAIRGAADALRANSRVAGACFADAVPMTDRPIPDAERSTRLAAFGDAFAAIRPVIRVARTNLTPREDVDVRVLLLNEARVEERVDLSLQVVGPTNQVLWKKKRSVKLPRHGKELWTGTISASGSTGLHRFVVRLMGPAGRLGEASAAFFVTKPVDAWPHDVNVMDPEGNWTAPCRRMVRDLDEQAPVIVIPPLATTVRAYPDNALGHVLGRVRDGSVAIVFSPPSDWNDLMAAIDASSDIAPLSSLETPGAAAFGRLHPVLDGLPAGSVLGRPYRGVLPGIALAGQSEEDIAWRVCWNGAAEPGHFVLVRRFGNGRLVFTPLQLLERLGRDPIAERLFVNLLSHSERRALASSGIPPVQTKAVEWLRRERGKLQTWRLIGPFPNWDGAGHVTEYPPEHEFSPRAAYAGWFRAVAWERCAVANDGRARVELDQLLAPRTLASDVLPGTYYAYADPTLEARSEAILNLRHHGSAKLWLNDRLIVDAAPDAEGAPVDQSEEVLLRQGRNVILLKLSVQRARPWFRLAMEISGSGLALRW